MFKFFRNKKNNGKINFFLTFTVIALVLVVGLYVLMPHATHAQGGPFGTTPYSTAPTNFVEQGSQNPSWTDYFSNPLLIALYPVIFALKLVALLELVLSSLFVYLSGLLLDFIVGYSILDIGKFLNGNVGVNIAWQTFRDLANMAFIFVLLYTAIMTILGLGGGSIKKVVAKVIIVALLLNFSLFFTKIFIDASNIVTIGFYNQIISQPCTRTGGTTSSLGAALTCRMGISTVFDPKLVDEIKRIAPSTWENAFKSLVTNTGESVFLFVAGFVFLAMALMLVVRFITLVFLLILSPLAFVAMALPNDRYSSKWWDSLISASLFPPLMMALFWAILQIVSAIDIQGAGAGLGNIFTGVNGKEYPGAGQLIGNFVIVTALMVGSLIIAKEFGAYGAGAAIKTLGNVRKGVQGYIGRNTLGRAGAALDKKIGDSDSRLGRFANTEFGRGLRGFTTGALAKGKYGGKIDIKKQKDEQAKADKKYGDTVLEKRETAKKNQYAIAEGRLTTAQAPVVAARAQQFRQETELNTDKKELEKLKAEQIAEQNALKNAGNSISDQTKQKMQTRINDRTGKINDLSNKINLAPIQIAQSKSQADRIEKAAESQITAAKSVVDAMNKINEEEAARLFTESGKEAEVREKAESSGLGKNELEEFMGVERKKFIADMKKDGFVKNELKRAAAEIGRNSSWKTNWALGSQNKAVMKALRESKKQEKKPETEMWEAAKKAAKEEGGGEEKSGGDKGEKKES